MIFMNDAFIVIGVILLTTAIHSPLFLANFPDRDKELIPSRILFDEWNALYLCAY